MPNRLELRELYMWFKNSVVLNVKMKYNTNIIKTIIKSFESGVALFLLCYIK